MGNNKCSECQEQTDRGAICDSCWETLAKTHDDLISRVLEITLLLGLGCENCGNDSATATLCLCGDCLMRLDWTESERDHGSE